MSRDFLFLQMLPAYGVLPPASKHQWFHVNYKPKTNRVAPGCSDRRFGPSSTAGVAKTWAVEDNCDLKSGNNADGFDG